MADDNERNAAARAKYLSMDNIGDNRFGDRLASMSTSCSVLVPSHESLQTSFSSTPPSPPLPLPTNRVINLLKGHPNDNHLPSEAISRVLKRMSLKSLPLNYGDEQGCASLRAHLAAFIAPDCDPNDLFITNGISHSLDMLAAALRPEDTDTPYTVYVEAPSYFLASQIFKDHGAEVLPAPMLSTGGIDPIKLSSLLSSTHGVSLVYVIPTHHNPTSFTYSLEHRVSLSNSCSKNGVYLLADEVYHLLSFASAPPPPPRFRSSSNRDPLMISLGSFTKIFSPGVRCGWVEADVSVVRRLVGRGCTQSQGGAAPFTGEMMRVALETGEVGRHLETLRGEYGRRCGVMVAMLRTSSKIKLPFVPEGGYFLWVEVTGVGEGFVSILESKYNIVVMDGSRAGMPSKGGVTYIRLCFACLDAVDIYEGVARLVKAVNETTGS